MLFSCRATVVGEDLAVKTRQVCVLFAKLRNFWCLRERPRSMECTVGNKQIFLEKKKKAAVSHGGCCPSHWPVFTGAALQASVFVSNVMCADWRFFSCR